MKHYIHETSAQFSHSCTKVTKTWVLFWYKHNIRVYVYYAGTRYRYSKFTDQHCFRNGTFQSEQQMSDAAAEPQELKLFHFFFIVSPNAFVKFAIFYDNSLLSVKTFVSKVSKCFSYRYTKLISIPSFVPRVCIYLSC